jgi:hypothetical protein
VGENILYKIGDQEVYFIPVYTSSSSGGVVSQIGTIAAVGASVTGTFYVGLGDTPVDAFENYLAKSAGEEPTSPPTGEPPGSFDVQDRIDALEKVFADAGLQVVKPTVVSAPVEFKEADAKYVSEADFEAAQKAVTEFAAEFAPDGGRVFEWQKDNVVNFGVLVSVDGVVENHYLSIEVS